MQNIRWLWLYCRKYGLRWCLCCLSIAIAVVCMCLVSYLSYVVQNALLQQVSLMGTDLLMGYVYTYDGFSKRFMEQVDSYGGVQSYSLIGNDVCSKDGESYPLKFVDGSYFDLFHIDLLQGRFFYDQEDSVVIGYDLAKVYEIGERILYHEQWYTVVGICDDVPESFYGDDNGCLFLPYDGYDGVDLQIVMKCKNEEYTKQYLTYFFDMYDVQYEIFSQSQIKEAMKVLLEFIKKVLYIIGGVSFLVSMLGIGNVMIFSIEQRKCEIGIRKAIGATDVAIFIQFLVEVCMMCIVGYLIGMVVSCVSVGIFSWYLDCGFYLDFSLCVGLLVLCLCMGIVAGVVPAYIACKQEVVEVLSL